MSINLDDVFINQFIVDKKVYQGFLNTFNDSNPLHVDEDFAQKKGFLHKVMHGNILGGFLSFFIGECLPLKNVVIHSQSIKYMKPVYLNDLLVLETKVSNVHQSVNVVEFTFSFKNHVSDEVVAKGKIQIGILN